MGSKPDNLVIPNLTVAFGSKNLASEGGTLRNNPNLLKSSQPTLEAETRNANTAPEDESLDEDQGISYGNQSNNRKKGTKAKAEKRKW